MQLVVMIENMKKKCLSDFQIFFIFFFNLVTAAL